jgi:hypothetical protein
LPVRFYSDTAAVITNIEAYVDPRLGVTVDGSNRITELIEQVDTEAMINTFDGTDFEPRPPHDWWPTRVANAFGSLPGIQCAPDLENSPLVRAQFLRLTGGNRPFPSGKSIFWVSRHTSNRTAANHATQNVPLTVTGDSSGDTFNNLGFSGGELGHSSVVGGVWTKHYFGSGYNDDVPRLYGFVHAGFPAETLKAYVNGEQVGDTVTGVTDYGSLHAWASLGSGYRAENMDTFGGDDGFIGTVGPLVVVRGVISADALEALYQWAQTVGYVP